MTVNIMQLRFFIEVAKHQTISKAADQLFRTQSAVTRGILQLEQQLNVTLFERHHQGVLLSDAGRFILPRVQNGLAHLQNITLHLKHHGESSLYSTGQSEPFFLYNYQRLQIFFTLCLTKNMKSTAQLLGLTQPAISAAIKLLEQSFGVELFERTVQGLKPSLSCQLIQKQVQLCLNELKPLYDELLTFHGQLQGTVHIGALPLIRAEVLPHVMGQMTTEHPAIRFVTYESAYEILSAQLRVGDIDFIIGAIRPDQGSADFSQHLLFSEDMVIVMGRQHPLLNQAIEQIRLNDLLNYAWILPRAYSPARELIQKSFAQLGLKAPNPTIETGDQTLIRGLLQSSSLLAIVSYSQMRQEVDEGQLVQLPITLPNTHRQIGISYRKHAILSHAAQLFLDSLLNSSRTS
ncbi:LysR family transcriptional regulator [Acinetobacter sp.]|uniref:LysR family transcriptional regulator n=1 Tax=Acinetobacter sp. TaxID=472 RepID=UPI0031DD2002